MFGLLASMILVIPLADVLQATNVLWGHDFTLNLDATARWLAGGPFYPPEQFQPFTDDYERILYPPVSLWLFAPLALLPRWLAGVLWAGFPIVALAYQWWRLRPSPVVWPFLALCIAWPPTVVGIAVLNPIVICVGLLALGTVHYWPAALIAVKTSVLPFAFWGAWTRSWWVAVGVLVLLSLPFGAMWLDWLAVIRNSKVGGIWHSVQQIPMMLFPILVWVSRSRR